MKGLRVLFSLFVIGTIIFLLSNNNELKAASQITGETYSDYYENSDLVYDMSDLSNITPYLYNNEEVLIDDYNDKLFKSNLKISAAATRATAYGDDPIVNIIPKELFTKEVNITICSGEEYVYAIETKYVDYSRSPYYESHVMVIDIDNNIKNNSFDIESNLIKVSITKLFEYNYLTLLKEYDYGNPEGLRDTVNFNSFIKVEKFDDDYIVVPKPTDSSMMNFYSLNEWTLNNINVIGSLKNINALNVYDEDYCLSDDKGLFFIGSGVEYNCHSIVFDEAIDFKQALLSMTDYLSYIPGLSELKLVGTAVSAINLGNSLVGTFKNLASTSSSIIENTYTSNASFASPDHYYYSTTQGQIKNYSELIKSESAHIYTIPLTKNSDYAEIDFHYSYTNEVATMFSQLVSFDFTIGKDVYSVVSGKESAIGVKNVDIDTTDYISNEYNCIGGKTVYNITPQYSQNYSINCGENDVIIYDVNQNIVSTSKNCYLEKNKTYSIYVINNSDESIIYDFFMSGYDISKRPWLDSLESAQYTFISNINGVRCITSNYDLEGMDLMFFNEGNVYQIIITNNTNTTGQIELNLNEIPDAIIDSEGQISNDSKSKYVRFNEDEGMYYIHYVANSCTYYGINNWKVVDFNLKVLNHKAGKEFYLIKDSVVSIEKMEYNILASFDNTTYETSDVIYTTKVQNKFFFFGKNETDYVYDIDVCTYKPIHSIDFNEYVNGYLLFDEGNYDKYKATISLNVYKNNEWIGNFSFSMYFYYLPSTLRIDSSFNYRFDTQSVKFNVDLYFNDAFNYINYKLYCDGKEINNNSSLSLTFDVPFNNIILNINKEYILEFDEQFNINMLDWAYNSDYIKVENNKIIISIKMFEEITQNGIKYYGISKEYQLYYALSYSQYGSFSYSDYVNDDIEIYGDINDLRLMLLNDITCTSEFKISNKVIFDGVLCGNGHTISNLNVCIDYSSHAKGIFAQNYGYIHDVDFINCTLKIGAVKRWNTTAGLITANNYGIIDVTISGTCLYIYNGDNMSKTLSSTTLYF